jgi:hypothetical protein
MNEFSDIENELRKLRPRPVSAELFKRMEEAMALDSTTEVSPLASDRMSDAELSGAPPAGAGESEKIVRPERFRLSWTTATIGLATAAVVLIFARLQLEDPKRPSRVAQETPAPARSDATSSQSTAAPAQFIPAAATEVVYNTRDEGLLFPRSSAQPLRRIRSHKRETFSWHNPATGASLQVSYPAEQVEFVPVSGQ